MRGCRASRRWSERSLDGTLALDDQFRFEDHLLRCEGCRRRHARAAALEEALARLAEPPLARLDVEASVRAVGAAIDAAPAPRRSPARRVAAGLAAAAAVLAAVVGWRVLADDDDPEPAPVAGGQAPAVEEEDDGPERVVVAPDPPVAPDAPGEALDPERLERARAEVALALLDELGALDVDASRGTVDDAVRRFEARAEALHSERWPVRSIVAGLVGRGEPNVARAATRFLGVRGGPVEMHTLRGALARREVKRDAVRALGDAGDLGLDGLAVALRDPELADLAREALAEVGSVAAAAVLAERAAAEGDGADATLAALAALGPPAVAPLLELAADGDLDRASLAALFAVVPGGGEELERLSGWDDATLSREARLVAGAALQPDALLGWLVDACEEPATRAAALEALGAYHGQPGLAALLAVAELDGVDVDELRGPAARVVAASGDALTDVARALVADGRAMDASALVDVVAISGQPEGVPALLALATDARLASADRQWAASAAAGLARPEHAPAFEAAYLACEAGDRRLAASLLLAVHALTDTARATDLVDARDSRAAGRLARLLERAAARPGGSELVLLARELEPLLPNDDPRTPSSRNRRTTP